VTATRPSSDAVPGRVAGIDYGTVRLGIAISDARRTLASPFDNYTRRSPQADAEYLRRLLTEERVTLVVVGLPIHVDGRESQKSREARKFGQWLSEITGLPVEFFDERFTTAEAQQFLGAAEMTKKQRKARLDKLAAQILLAGYLESGGATTTPTGLDD
jgi:putative Holliday junction resolvase